MEENWSNPKKRMDKSDNELDSKPEKIKVLVEAQSKYWNKVNLSYIGPLTPSRMKQYLEIIFDKHGIELKILKSWIMNVELEGYFML